MSIPRVRRPPGAALVMASSSFPVRAARGPSNGARAGHVPRQSTRRWRLWGENERCVVGGAFVPVPSAEAGDMAAARRRSGSPIPAAPPPERSARAPEPTGPADQRRTVLSIAADDVASISGRFSMIEKTPCIGAALRGARRQACRCPLVVADLVDRDTARPGIQAPCRRPRSSRARFRSMNSGAGVGVGVSVGVGVGVHVGVPVGVFVLVRFTVGVFVSVRVGVCVGAGYRSACSSAAPWALGVGVFVGVSGVGQRGRRRRVLVRCPSAAYPSGCQSASASACSSGCGSASASAFVRCWCASRRHRHRRPGVGRHTGRRRRWRFVGVGRRRRRVAVSNR